MKAAGEPDQTAMLYFTSCVTSVTRMLFGKLPSLFATDGKLFLDFHRKTEPMSDRTRCTFALLWIQPDVGVQASSVSFEKPSLSRMQDDKDEELGGVGVVWETIAP